MNIFRLSGDLMHLLSIVVILLKIGHTRSCRGISLKTQELYLLVFVCRYLDIFHYVSFYNTLMKLVFLGTSGAIVYYMRYHRQVKMTYDKEHDSFKYELIVLACAVLALLVHKHSKTPFLEVLWTFSIYLEAVAILPQLVLLQRTENIDNLTGNYVFMLGMYRALYILNWIYRAFTDNHYHFRKELIVWVAGIVQSCIYVDFFYYYIKSWQNNTKLALPA